MPAANGIAATAINCADRATALLTPEATPAWWSSTEASTVAVRGATVQTRPIPKTMTDGQHGGDVLRAGLDVHHQQEAAGHEERADRHRDARADPLRQRSRVAGQCQHQQRHRQQGGTRGERLVVQGRLQIDDQEESGGAERAVDERR